MLHTYIRKKRKDSNSLPLLRAQIYREEKGRERKLVTRLILLASCCLLVVRRSRGGGEAVNLRIRVFLTRVLLVLFVCAVRMRRKGGADFNKNTKWARAQLCWCLGFESGQAKEKVIGPKKMGTGAGFLFVSGLMRPKRKCSAQRIWPI